ncbi:MAG: DUF692 domain-containing protein [Proteobacteria bacterium]|nr:DUF692 domain-containing protein [Pseudomonadota bacterium]MBS0269316.1 DUF692 domain-containing protein [Pseudomonadota bacterium]
MRQVKENALGIGLRSELLEALCIQPAREDIDFLEIAPENWMGIGGRKRDQLDILADKYPLIAHGLSLSIADTVPLNVGFIRDVCSFLNDYGISIYSDHLSMCRDSSGYLYDLLPVPRRKENIEYLTGRICQVQDIVGRQLVLENISYYHRYEDQMPEAEFLAAIAEQSGCGLLLDINNVYVNSRNHLEDAVAMVRCLPSNAIVYYHVAGHLELEDGSLLDTHGTKVGEEVVRLGHEVWGWHGPRPLLLERDNQVPSLDELIREVGDVQKSIAAGDRYACSI